MKKYFRIATMAYLIWLGAMLGAVIYAGAVVAPVIFHSAQWLGSEVLSHFQEGLIMTRNFVLLSYAVTATIIFVFLYEGYKYKMGERDKLTQAAAFVVIFTGAMFNWYYLPDIVTMQMAGEQMTQSQAFINTHKGSELDFKIFALGILVLMIQNMRKACK
ncbi:DUF4149 domain-containing protein [Nitratifractor salsuginis]|uniref:TMEM205-like domain-containing protein n=1 Tax=Nitratifractor salsuginis (strain DSM 16511 / JCM 12458 / E9I37-1) TaxID=749222 RepID=E6X084_NITSE|nr:DUF4149 domain-containing protein [Nitratifractor salsuginis]ADV45673.1 hypothetical protein Nitsa_0403 [Nitratifractor salsuginis DSM 16511]